MRPVLYLDIDDTILSWADGHPRARRDTAPFLRWALEHFEVRWLTRWCPSGEMAEHLLADLSRMTGLDAACLRAIPACSWDERGPKADGIAWIEHVVGGREFYWVENDEGLSPRDLELLEQAGFRERYLSCNITRDENALARVRAVLEERLNGAASHGPPASLSTGSSSAHLSAASEHDRSRNA